MDVNKINEKDMALVEKLFPYASAEKIPFTFMYGDRRIKGIPEDFALLGFDGGLNYRLMSPTITQIIQSPQETAEESYHMLIEMMENNIPASKIHLQPSLEVGDSTKRKI